MDKAASGMLTTENFWTHRFTKSLNVRGRLALCYVLFQVGDSDQVIIEDMSVFTGLESSECRDYLQLFYQQGYLRSEVRWS
jgi:hypothetical protein